MSAHSFPPRPREGICPSFRGFAGILGLPGQPLPSGPVPVCPGSPASPLGSPPARTPVMLFGETARSPDPGCEPSDDSGEEKQQVGVGAPGSSYAGGRWGLGVRPGVPAAVVGAWALREEGVRPDSQLGGTGQRGGSRGPGLEGAGHRGAVNRRGSDRGHENTDLGDTCPRPPTPGAATRFLPPAPPPRPVLRLQWEPLVLLWPGTSRRSRRSPQ